MFFCLLFAIGLPSAYGQVGKRPDVVIEDFETGSFAKWTLEGNCFGSKPENDKFFGRVLSGWNGDWYLNTFHPSDRGTGKASSISFLIERTDLTFLVGGGHFPDTCFMQLVIAGKPVRTAAGLNNVEMKSVRWDVREFCGKEAHLEIVDNERRPSGYLMIDHIVETDSPKNSLSDPALINRMKEWTGSLAKEPLAAPNAPVVNWRMLVLVYPNTDTDYSTVKGEPKHFTGSLSSGQVQNLTRSLAEIPKLVKMYSRGLCNLQLDIKSVDRPLSWHVDPKRLTHQGPIEADTREEMDRYNNPAKYDSVIIQYHPGPVPQDLAGAGGGGLQGTHAAINYGDEWRWMSKTGVTWKSWGQNCYVHEWAHGLDGYFSSRGYVIEPLHHLYKYQSMGLGDHTDLFPALFQGLLVHEADMRYGYSKSLWMCGSPRHPVALPPCQLLSPAPESKLAQVSATFTWASSPAPDGYDIQICPVDKPGQPVVNLHTRRNFATVALNNVAPGNYIWYARACAGSDRSEIGDAFPITVTETATLAPVKIGSTVLSTYHVSGSGSVVQVVAEVSSPSGINRAMVEYQRPDGRKQQVPLRRRSLFERDTVWEGAIWIPENSTGSMCKSEVAVKVTDHSGRTTTSYPSYVQVDPTAPSEQVKSTQPSLAVAGNPSAPWASIYRPFEQNLRVQISGKLSSKPEGNLWAEVTYADGKRDYFPFYSNGWDGGDWRTGTVQGLYAVAVDSNGDGPTATLRYAYRTSDGTIVRSAAQEIVMPKISLTVAPAEP